MYIYSDLGCTYLRTFDVHLYTYFPDPAPDEHPPNRAVPHDPAGVQGGRGPLSLSLDEIRDPGAGSRVPLSRALRRSFVLAAPFLLLGCEPDPPPIPEVEPFSGFSEMVRFGDLASQIQESRDVAINDEGEMLEYFTFGDLVYEFDLHADSTPPPLQARLLGLQLRKEYWDTLGLWTDWRTRAAMYETYTQAEPVCSRITSGLLTTTRADYSGTPRLSVGVQIFMGQDGQSFESFRISGVTLMPVDSIPELAEGAGRVSCAEMGPGRR